MKPKINTKSAANGFAGPNERIISVSDDKGEGCLISVTSHDDGRLVIEVYHADPNVVVRAQEVYYL
jgi:hypothetical protein